MIDFESLSETFNTFDFVADEMGWRMRNALSAPTRSLEDISEGRVFQRGPNIYRTGDSAYLGRIAYVRGATVEVGNRGTIFLNNFTTRARVDDPQALHAQPRAIIEGDLTMLGDTEQQPINRVVSLAPRGELVYVRDEVPAGRQRYVKVLAPAPGEPVPKTLVTGWRLATSEELLTRGVAGYLARNAQTALERLKLTGLARDDGTVTTDGSEIVRILAANLKVQPVITYALGENV